MKQTVVFDMHKIIYHHKIGPKLGHVEPMPKAIDTFLHFYNTGYKIVIISTSVVQDSRKRLEFLLDEYGLGEEDIADIINNIDILSMKFFGSKNNTEDWKKAMEPYANIEYIFEDGEHKLKAAGQAARELGHEPELYLNVLDFIEEQV